MRMACGDASQYALVVAGDDTVMVLPKVKDADPFETGIIARYRGRKCQRFL